MRIKFFLVLVLAGMFYATDVQASSWQVLNKGTGLPGNNVNSLGTAKNQMAVGTDNGIGLYNGETCLWKTIALPEKVASSQIRDLAFDSKGNIWVASSNGVISIQNGSVEIFGVADGLPTLDIERIQVRKEEIFAGSFGGFVSKAFVPEAGRTSFAPVNYSRSSEDENPRICAIGITGLAMLNSSEGWVSTKGAGLIYNRGMSKDILTMENGLDSDWVEAFWVFEGQQKVEHLIAATLKGMTIFRDRKKIGTISVPVKSENSWITSVIAIYCDDYQAPRKGLNDEWDAVKFLGKRAMWVGTKNEGLFRFENGKWTNFVPENSLLPSRNINRLYFHQGRLLVCTDAGLVVIPLAANSFDEFKYIGIGSKYFKTIFPHLTITAVNHLAKRSDFWIATDGALKALNPPEEDR
ncbi:hypothetical protein HYY75_04415 [bacterium]|nr:hypothetical protein [bacterium]